MKKLKKVLSLVLVLAMCVSAFGVSAFAANYDEYKDADTVKTDYAANETAIDVVTGLKIINGDGGYLKLGNGLTRAEAAKILTVVDSGVKAAEATNSSTVSTGYSDMKGHWASGYVAYCTAKNFLAGNGDGTFEPDGQLTGYAFGKMMLNVLGVGLREIEIQGTTTLVNNYTGNLWEAKVLADGTELGLFDKVSSNLSGAITRADAMQITYNALFINRAIDSNGTYDSNYRAKRTYTNDVTSEFRLSYDSTSAAADAFKRPQTTVKDSKGDPLTTYADVPVLTYTKGVSGEDIWKDLGKPAINGITAYTDGASATVAIDKGAMGTVGGNGILTEVYKSVTPGEYTVIQVTDYLGEITGFKAGAPGEKNVISVKQLFPATGSPVVKDFETDAYAKADIGTKVIFTKAKNGSSWPIQSVDTAETVSGKPSQAKVTTMGPTSVYTTIVDGTTYEYHKDVDNNLSQGAARAPGGQEVTYYLDSHGYVIQEDSVPAPVNYAVVVDTATDSDMWGNNTRYAKLLLTDGTVAEVVVENNDKGTPNTTDDYNGTDDDIVTYEVKNDKYVLTKVENNTTAGITAKSATAATNTTDVALTPNKAQQTLVNTPVTADSKTVFVLGDVTPMGMKYTVYTGTAGLPAAEANVAVTAATPPVEATKSGYVAKDGVAQFVYVYNPKYTDTAVQSIMYIPTKGGTEIHDPAGAYIEIQAYVDGEIQTVKVDKAKYDTTPTNNVKDVIGSKYTTNDRGLIDSVIELAGVSRYAKDSSTSAGTVSCENGVATLSDKKVTVDENTKVYVFGEPGPVEAKSASELNYIEGNVDVDYYTYDNVAVAIFITKTAP